MAGKKKAPVTSVCANCRFFYAPDSPYNVDRYGNPLPLIPGECRIKPPSLYGTDGFPYTNTTLWCGEFQLVGGADQDTTARALAEAVLDGDTTAAKALADRIKEC